MVQDLLSSKYKKPEKYKLVPEGNVIVPFGLDVSNEEVSFHQGVFFGRKGQLCYNIYSPIDAYYSYDYRKRVLILWEEELGLAILIHGIQSLELSFRERYIKRGTYLGTAFQFLSKTPGVYVECITSSKDILEDLGRRFMTSGEEFSYHLAERNYIKEFCKLTLVPYYKLRPRVYQSKRKNQIREFNPYWLIAPSPLKKGRVVYLNYLTLFY